MKLLTLFHKQNYFFTKASPIELWFAKHILCFKKHKFEYSNMVKAYKCVRCLTPDYERNDSNLHARLLEQKFYYERLQTPFWKLSGMAPKPHDIALDKYLKWMGLTYGQWKQKRDHMAATNPSAYNEWEKNMNKKIDSYVPKSKKN